MSFFKIELISLAETELTEAYIWYNKKKSGLGNRFVKEVSNYFNNISENPYMFAVKYNNELRFAPLQVFPYLISYWIDEKQKTVFVLSIFHTSRNPGKFEE